VGCDLGCFRLESPSGRLYWLIPIQPTPRTSSCMRTKWMVDFFYLSVNRMLKQMLEDFFQRIRTSRHEFTATISIFWCNNTCMYDESRRYLCLSSSRGDEHDRENGLSSHGNETEHWNTTFWFLWTCSMTQLKVPWSKPPYGGQIL